ncbi:MAG: acyltransferase [Lachnospiraceae bacterium]|nr:acyltransferase [Lachnospiraceae bacterium]
MKQIINKLIFPNTHSSEAYVGYLRKNGVTIGKRTWFVRPKTNSIDVQRGIFVKIGDDVCITEGVKVLAHDWSYSVLANYYKKAPGRQRCTIIGNNVFIGNGSIILMGANIGDNVIIGAGSVVSGQVESNSVYAGNPARKIYTLDQYYEKLSKDFETSAACYFNRYREVYGQYPRLENVGLYATLFVEKSDSNMKKYFSQSAIPFALKNMEKRYDTIEEFMEKQEEIK